MLEARDVLAEKRHQIFLIDHENNRMALSMFVVSLVVKVRVEAKKDIELAEKWACFEMTQVFVSEVKASNLSLLYEIEIMNFLIWSHNELTRLIKLALNFGEYFYYNIIWDHLLQPSLMNVPEKIFE